MCRVPGGLGSEQHRPCPCPAALYRLCGEGAPLGWGRGAGAVKILGLNSHRRVVGRVGLSPSVPVSLPPPQPCTPQLTSGTFIPKCSKKKLLLFPPQTQVRRVVGARGGGRECCPALCPRTAPAGLSASLQGSAPRPASSVSPAALPPSCCAPVRPRNGAPCPPSRKFPCPRALGLLTPWGT